MKCVMNLIDDPRLQFEPWSKGEHYGGTSASIAKLWGTQVLGFHQETLAPGKFSCPYHVHQKEEELFIVFSGSMMVRQDGEFFEIKKGDLVFFKTGVAHQFYNHTDAPCVFFALSNDSGNEVCEYPDSNKKLVQTPSTESGRGFKITQNGIEVEYWKDELDPRSKWPAEIIERNK